MQVLAAAPLQTRQWGLAARQRELLVHKVEVVSLVKVGGHSLQVEAFEQSMQWGLLAKHTVLPLQNPLVESKLNPAWHSRHVVPSVEQLIQ